MHIALGLRAHSGWAVLVAIGGDDDRVHVLERRRIELVDDVEHEWAGQPYHAADGQPPEVARAIVAHGIAEARCRAEAELRGAVERLHAAGHDVTACAVLAPAPLPAWSVEDILAVHLRMHQAEGALYPGALLDAANRVGVTALRLAQKTLSASAAHALGMSEKELSERIARLGKTVGAPWAADHKAAALAAMSALAPRIPRLFRA